MSLFWFASARLLIPSLNPIPGHAARDRWRIIRGSYVRYLKQTDTEGAQKKEYYLAKYLGFLNPHIKIRDASFKAASEVEASDNDSASSSPVRKSSRKKRARVDSTEEDIFQIDPEGMEGGQNSEAVYCEANLTADEGGAQTYTLRNGRLEAAIIQPNLSNLEASTTTTSVVQEEERDADLMFFKSLLPEVRALPSKKKNKFKITVMSALMDLMDD